VTYHKLSILPVDQCHTSTISHHHHLHHHADADALANRLLSVEADFDGTIVLLIAAVITNTNEATKT
jgi:hypothetical protein